MTDLDQLRDDLLAAVDSATTPEAIEGLRVAALGKAGSVTGLLKTLGGMSPEERQVQGPRIHVSPGAVTAAIGGRRAMLERAELDARLARETLDMTLPASPALAGTVH